MTRALGLFGFTGGFLIISPSMRQTLMDAGSISLGLLQNYAPYSYVGLGILALGGVAMTLASGSSPR